MNPEPSGAHKSAHQPQPTVVKSRTLFCLHIFFKEISKFCLVNNHVFLHEYRTYTVQYYAYEKVERGPSRIIFSSSQILCTV
jgi:hypothetical protein